MRPQRFLILGGDAAKAGQTIRRRGHRLCERQVRNPKRRCVNVPFRYQRGDLAPDGFHGQTECDAGLCTEHGDRLRKQASKPTAFNSLSYSAAAGDATLVELAEWDPEFAEPFAPWLSASG
jgi:hypothetical protein